MPLRRAVIPGEERRLGRRQERLAGSGGDRHGLAGGRACLPRPAEFADGPGEAGERRCVSRIASKRLTEMARRLLQPPLAQGMKAEIGMGLRVAGIELDRPLKRASALPIPAQAKLRGSQHQMQGREPRRHGQGALVPAAGGFERPFLAFRVRQVSRRRDRRRRQRQSLPVAAPRGRDVTGGGEGQAVGIETIGVRVRAPLRAGGSRRVHLWRTDRGSSRHRFRSLAASAIARPQPSLAVRTYPLETGQTR